MKKLLLFVGLIIVLACAMFGGLHIGQSCPADAKDFAAHITQQGHIEEFGGIDNVINFLKGIADGSIDVKVYGDATRTIIAASSSPYGSGVIIYGTGVTPTGFPATTARINDLVRGMTLRTGKADASTARDTARCFGESLIPVTTSMPSVSMPVSGTAIMVGAAALLVAFMALKKKAHSPA